VIDVFVDCCFRHNFDPSNADDAFLVRRIAFLNEVLLDAGLVRPISPRRPAILAELAMVIRNVDSLRDHRALLRYLMGIVFLIGNSLEDTSMAVEDDPTVFLCELVRPIKGIDS
jgi:hypothetical protein